MSDEINRINPTVVEGAEDIHGAETFDADYSPLNRPSFSWRDNMAQSRRTLDKKQVGDMMKMRRMGRGRFDAQGYNDKLDESMGMSKKESKMEQSMKDRRDESKGMEKGMGRRAYQRVGTMDAEGIGSILGNVIPEPHFVGFEEIQREKMKNQNTKDAEGCGNCGSALVMNAEGEHGCGCGTEKGAEGTMLGSIGEGNDFGQNEAETFEASSRRQPKHSILYQLFQDPSFRDKLSFGPSNPSYGGYIGYTTNPYAGDAVGLNIGYYSYGKKIKTGEEWEQWAKGRMTSEQFEDFEQGVEDGFDSSPDRDWNSYDGGLECGCGATATVEIDKGNVHTCAYCFGVMVGKAKFEIPIIEEAISVNMDAEEFGAERRYRYGNRYITRDSKGRFKKNVSVGRSLSADRRRKAKTVKGVGQGGKGDYRAESKFDELADEIAEQYEKKGKSKEEAEKIGKATAYKVGVAKYGKRGMTNKAKAGMRKKKMGAEGFNAEGGAGYLVCTHDGCYNEENLDTDGWLIYSSGYGGHEVLCPTHAPYGAVYLVCTYDGCREEGNIDDDGWYLGHFGQKPTVYCPKHGREEYPEYYNAEGFNTEETTFGSIGEGNDFGQMEAEENYYTRDATFVCPESDCGCRGCYGCMGEDENPNCRCCGYVFKDGPTGMGEHTTYQCSCGVRACDGCIGEDDPTCPSCGIVFVHTTGPFDEQGNYIGSAEGDYVVVKRPHHMARVRKDRAVYDPQWNKPNMHTDMNKEGKMYDEKIGGWVDMNFDDGDVVDLTQGVLAKGGVRVGGMTASAIVLAIAGLSGYYYARR